MEGCQPQLGQGEGPKEDALHSLLGSAQQRKGCCRQGVGVNLANRIDVGVTTVSEELAKVGFVLDG